MLVWRRAIGHSALGWFPTCQLWTCFLGWGPGVGGLEPRSCSSAPFWGVGFGAECLGSRPPYSGSGSGSDSPSIVPGVRGLGFRLWGVRSSKILETTSNGPRSFLQLRAVDQRQAKAAEAPCVQLAT